MQGPVQRSSTRSEVKKNDKYSEKYINGEKMHCYKIKYNFKEPVGDWKPCARHLHYF